MAPRITIKDHFLETRLFNIRAVTALIIVSTMIGALILRLVQLQIVDYQKYTTQAEGNRVKLVALPPIRGIIYDRQGIPLAENLTSYHLEVTAEQVKDMDATLAGLQKIIDLRDEDLARFKRQLKRTRRFDPVPLRLNLSEREVARFALERHRFPGVDIATNLLRHYPQGSHMSHVIGYVGRIDEDELQNIDTADYSGTTHIGKIGLEKSYEDELHGTVGNQQVEINAQGRVVRQLEYHPPLPGNNLHLSLDARLQTVAEQALGEDNGALVAIDPSNGEVLAMVSKPGYDPNPFASGIDSASYRALQNDDNRPLYDRVLRGQYPPGSTIKPMMGLAGLYYGVSTIHKRTWCPGYFQLPNVEHKYRDWKKTGHGTVDLAAAIIESCDVYFYELALALGIDRMHEFMTRFGFGSPTGIDLPNELGGLQPSREWKRARRRQAWFPGETLIAGIGQGYTLSTPLQLAVATAAVAMRGQHYTPRLVHSIEDPSSNTLKLLAPKALPAIELPTESWDAVIEAMEAVVHGERGTARRIGLDAPYRIAGKTGTAQVFSLKQDQKYKAEELEKKLRDHALFIAFAPVDKPRIAVALIVENGGSGGAIASPIARQVMDQYLLHTP